MKRFLLAAFLSLFALFSAPVKPSIHAQLGGNGLPVGFFFDQDFTKTPPCSTTVTVACISGFSILTELSSTGVVVNTLAVPNPATVNNSGPTLSIPSGAYTPPAAQVSAVNYSVQAQVLYKDPSGAALPGAASSGVYSFVVPGTFQPPPAPSTPRVTP